MQIRFDKDNLSEGMDRTNSANYKVSLYLFHISLDSIIHWASKETYHLFKTTPTKINYIKINRIRTPMSFNTPQ